VLGSQLVIFYYTLFFRAEFFTIGKDPTAFSYLDFPEPRTLKRGQQLLKHLDAIDSTGKLTPLGEQMAQMPLEPPVSGLDLSLL
jgi:HrpA-like RNA helicase